MSELYVLDANVFIQAKRRFYPFDVCPGYWKALVWHQQRGHVLSVDRVRDELKRGADDLWSWVQSEFGEASFVSTDEQAVIQRYAEMVTWVQAQPQFFEQAREEFAKSEVADGWVGAYAKTVDKGVVVTLEEFSPDVKRKVPLPNICKAFDIEPITPYEMLRRLGVRLDWQPPS